MDWLPIAIAIIAAIPGVAALLKEWKFGTPDLVGKYEELVDRQAKRIDALYKSVEGLETSLRSQEDELEELRNGVTLLIAQLKANGITPVWQPKEKPIK